MNVDLQETRRKYRSHEYILLQRHPQPPNAWHWQKQDGKVRDDIEHSSTLKGSVDTITMACRHERVPYLLPWSTDRNLKYHHNEIED